LPASLKPHAIHARREGEYLITGTQHKMIHRMRLGNHREVPIGQQRLGQRELPGRLEDMELEGIDAEICFPSLGLWIYAVGDADAEAASVRLYNDWCNGFFSSHLDRFVRCGMLPVLDLSNTLAELDYVASKGFTAAMLPAVTPVNVPKYNDERWDPIFAKAAAHGIVMVMHTGTGLESVIAEKGPGGAIANYTNQAMDAMKSATLLVAGGVLDRNPTAKVAFIEAGASWLVALAERMDEVEEAHAVYVRPKLTRRPSRIIDEQVWASFQNDRACLVAADAGLPGARNCIWGSDYPHGEGTFPESRSIIDKLRADLRVSDETWRNAIGLNAARLFGIEPVVHTREQLAA
jgi:predicted TIM-barrel fold metal-dependent hydrolase